MKKARNIRRKETAAVTADDQRQSQQAANWREYFFQTTRNPVSVSNLIVALAAGTPLQVERIPPELLAPVVLLGTIGLRAFQQQIVDDYVALLQRMEEQWKEADVANKLPSGESMQFLYMNPVNSILLDGPRGDYFIPEMPELQYMEGMFHEMVEETVDNLYAALNKEAKILL